MEDKKLKNIEKVSAGDDDDTMYEIIWTKRIYNVGDEVEVYDSSFWHTTTERGKIIKAEQEFDDKYHCWVWFYTVQIYKTKNTVKVRADDIELDSAHDYSEPYLNKL